jgi:hypothetical protein
MKAENAMAKWRINENMAIENNNGVSEKLAMAMKINGENEENIKRNIRKLISNNG